MIRLSLLLVLILAGALVQGMGPLAPQEVDAANSCDEISCPDADLDGNGVVDGLDYSILSNCADSVCDFDGNGYYPGIGDLELFLTHYGDGVENPEVFFVSVQGFPGNVPEVGEEFQVGVEVLVEGTAPQDPLVVVDLPEGGVASDLEFQSFGNPLPPPMACDRFLEPPATITRFICPMGDLDPAFLSAYLSGRLEAPDSELVQLGPSTWASHLRLDVQAYTTDLEPDFGINPTSSVDLLVTPECDPSDPALLSTGEMPFTPSFPGAGGLFNLDATSGEALFLGLTGDSHGYPNYQVHAVVYDPDAGDLLSFGYPLEFGLPDLDQPMVYRANPCNGRPTHPRPASVDG